MSDHPSKYCERQVTEFLEHLVGEALPDSEALKCFNLNVTLMVKGEQDLVLHSKKIWKKIEILTTKMDQKKDKALQYLNTGYLSSEISTNKYVHMFVTKAEYVEQYFMHVTATVVQAVVKLFYIVCNSSFSRREFFRCLISVTGNILCAF